MEQNNSFLTNPLTITSDCEVINVQLCPNRTPTVYQHTLKDLIEIAGMTEQEAKDYLLQPIELELFYANGLGLFAVESAAVESTQIYNPYTGEEIPIEEDQLP